MRAARVSLLHAVMGRFCEHFEFWFAVAALSAAWLYYPYCETGPTFCIWKKLLGVACPGCGLTRGVCFLVHGRWAEAVGFNPLSPLAVAILLWNILCEALRSLKMSPTGFCGVTEVTTRRTNVLQELWARHP